MKNVQDMSFEEALAELELIVKKIDSGSETLESAVSNFERGVLLRNYCQTKLQDAKLKIEKIAKDAQGNISTITHEL